MFIDDYDPDEDTRSELRAQDKSERSFQRALIANPDCRDPDHPGCDSCMEANDES